MSTHTLFYIGNITIKSLRDFILDNNLTDHDTLMLNQVDFDNIIIEFRAIYNEGIIIPYYLIGVLIEVDSLGRVPFNRIGIIKDDNNRFENDYTQDKLDQPNDDFKYETIYRCGWCGNVVDFDGSEFDSSTRQFKIDIYEKYKDTLSVKRINGMCCANRSK